MRAQAGNQHKGYIKALLVIYSNVTQSLVAWGNPVGSLFMELRVFVPCSVLVCVCSHKHSVAPAESAIHCSTKKVGTRLVESQNH